VEAGTGKVPDGGNPYLIDQFIRCIDVFWRSGGAIVWWCDNDPLTFECNEWLKIAEFPSGKTDTGADFPGGKVQLQLVTGCEDKRTLRRGDIKTGRPCKVFSNKENLNFHFDHRHTLAHNLASLSEVYIHTDFTLFAKIEWLVLSGRNRGILAVLMKNYWPESEGLVFGSR
jgi:hypothetical protein